MKPIRMLLIMSVFIILSGTTSFAAQWQFFNPVTGETPPYGTWALSTYEHTDGAHIFCQSWAGAIRLNGFSTSSSNTGGHNIDIDYVNFAVYTGLEITSGQVNLDLAGSIRGALIFGSGTSAYGWYHAEASSAFNVVVRDSNGFIAGTFGQSYDAVESFDYLYQENFLLGPGLYNIEVSLGLTSFLEAEGWITSSMSGLDAFSLTATVSDTPIPGAFWLLGSGLLGLIGIKRRKRL